MIDRVAMWFDRAYFIGIGGIGMSALARWCNLTGVDVAGYDRVESAITRSLASENIEVHYDDSVELIPERFKIDRDRTLVVYTPAVPSDMSELQWFDKNGFTIVKRSRFLGEVAVGKYVMAVAGTHGKTTTSSMIAHFNRVVTGGGNAFLGGISKNFGSNLVCGEGRRLAVEADEFDRSFLQLYPDVAVVTSVDPDHLDIYGTAEAVQEAFEQFISQIKEGGTLVIKLGVELKIPNGLRKYTYSIDAVADFCVEDVRVDGCGDYWFTLVVPDRKIENCHLGVPGWVNVENCVAAAAALWCAGEVDDEKLREAMSSFSGVKRRMDFYVKSEDRVYFDDYAHHPRELSAAISSVRKIYPTRHLTAIFQPHLYTRTKDFSHEFAESLSQADRVILLPIYPAREKPIEGVSSKLIFDDVCVEKYLVEKRELADVLVALKTDVVGTFGAGDIELLCESVNNVIRNK